MASEATIKRVLDLLTIEPQPKIAAMGIEAVDHAKSMRKIVGTKNVVAVGISEKIKNGKPTGKLALTFYVEKKVSLNKLKASMAIPPTVPEALSGEEAVPTDVVVIGKLVPEANIMRHPVQPGNSIGHIDSTAGTLGAIVTKGTALHILSNSHVLAMGGTAKNGDSITYPGPIDGGKMPDDLVARLSGFKKFVTGGAFVNRVDCAIAKPTASRLPDVVSEIIRARLPEGHDQAPARNESHQSRAYDRQDERRDSRRELSLHPHLRRGRRRRISRSGSLYALHEARRFRLARSRRGNRTRGRSALRWR